MSATLLQSLTRLFPSSDEQLMWRVQTQGEEAAFAELVERWQTRILSLCTRMLGDLHRAQDVAQEAFARLYAHRQSFRPDARFGTYFWRIALNACYDELRRRQRRAEFEVASVTEDGFDALENHPLGAPGPDDLVMEQETSALVRDALQRLPEAYRTVLVLRHYEGLKFREIAEVLNLPDGTVKSRMADGLTQLARLLEPAMDAVSSRRARGQVRPRQTESLML